MTKDGQITNAGLNAYWALVDAAVAFNVKKRDAYLSKCSLNPKNAKLHSKRRFADEDLDMQFFKRMKNKKTPTTGFRGLPSRTIHGQKLPTPPPL